MKKKVRKTLWREWGELPEFMRNEEVKPYYEALNRRRGSIAVKRTFDFAMSSVMLAALSPVFAALALMIKLDSKGPVFYRQERVTQYGRVFKIYKFRTMVNNASRMGTQVTVSNDARITRVGRWLRKLRIDEFPQLFNILAGDMTLVGTRPEVLKYVDAYTPEMYATLLLPAGLTSRTSIAYKDEERLLSNAEDADKVYIEEVLPAKMRYNLESLKKFGLKSDMSVLWNTFVSVIH